MSNVIRHVTCVTRTFNGRTEFIEFEDAAEVADGETLTSGMMFSTRILSGPSSSHRITVWDPRGAVIRSKYMKQETAWCAEPQAVLEAA